MVLRRRDFLKETAVATAALAAGLARADEPRRKPNIIYIFADQMRAHVLGCYGNKQVPTPNFDALAGNGTTFDNALSTYPVCSPYRAMLLTGRYPMANGTISNDRALHDGLPTVAKICREQGYATGYIGKWHLESNRTPFVPKERRQGFDFWAVNNCSHRYMDHFYCMDTPEQVRFKGYEPVVQTDLAIDYIKKHKDRPFCLFMSWGPPHDPYTLMPKEYLQRVEAEKLEFRGNVTERAFVDGLLAEAAKMSESKQIAGTRASKRKTIDDDELLRKQYIHGYCAHTVALDDCLGRIQKTLSEAGLAQDTILAFSSDHGDMLGSHRMASKQMPFEESIRIPFLVQYPGRIQPGGRTDALLTPVDAMPTLLGLAGLTCPKVDGIDMSAAACGGKSDARDAALIMKLVPGGNPWVCNGITPWRGVRTKRYTYTRLLDRGPWILFDNREDPYQLKNLIGHPEHRELQQQLDERTTALMQEAGDPGDTAAIQSTTPRQKKK